MEVFHIDRNAGEIMKGINGKIGKADASRDFFGKACLDRCNDFLFIYFNVDEGCGQQDDPATKESNERLKNVSYPFSFHWQKTGENDQLKLAK